MLNDSKIAAYTAILQEELLLARVYRAHRRRVLCRKTARGVGRKTGKDPG